MTTAATSMTSSHASPNASAMRFLAWRFGIQVLFMGLALAMGYRRLNDVYDVNLVRESLWMIPAVFLLGQVWYAVKAYRLGLADDALLVSYRAFSERFWVICITLTLVFGQLATR